MEISIRNPKGDTDRYGLKKIASIRFTDSRVKLPVAEAPPTHFRFANEEWHKNCSWLFQLMTTLFSGMLLC